MEQDTWYVFGAERTRVCGSKDAARRSAEKAANRLHTRMRVSNQLDSDGLVYPSEIVYPWPGTHRSFDSGRKVGLWHVHSPGWPGMSGERQWFSSYAGAVKAARERAGHFGRPVEIYHSAHKERFLVSVDDTVALVLPESTGGAS